MEHVLSLITAILKSCWVISGYYLWASLTWHLGQPVSQRGTEGLHCQKAPPTRVWQQPKLPQLHSTILETGLFFVSQRFKSITCLENILQHSGSTAEGVHWFDRFTQLPDVSGCNLRGDVSVFLLISLVIFMSWNINCIASIRSHSCLWSFLMLWNFYKLHEIEIE